MRDIFLQGGAILLAITALLAAGELAFGPGQGSQVRLTSALLSSLVACGLLLFQYLYFRDQQVARRARAQAAAAVRELAEARRYLQRVEQDRHSLRRQVENLAAHREISRAATAHTSFDDFLNELAGVVHDIAGAQDLSLFTVCDKSGEVLPRAYYRIARATELSLSFSSEGGVEVLNEMENGRAAGGVLDAELLGAARLSVTPRGPEVVVVGGLLLREREVGTLRLVLRQFESGSGPAPHMVTQLVATDLGQVRLGFHNVLAALEHGRPVHYRARVHSTEIACPLQVEGEQIGVVKVGFDCRADDDREAAMEQRLRLLQESVTHIAHAIRGERIYQQAIRDGLTGLYNKQYMLGQLDGYFRVASRHHTRLCLLMLDIDHFKRVNDTYGHLTGDIILREVAAILLQSIRTSDLACRYGGEELAVILPAGDLQGAAEVAERVRLRIERESFRADDGREVPVTASLGVAAFASEMRRVEDLIARADAALYQSKEGGRNRVTVWRAGSPAAKPASVRRGNKGGAGKRAPAPAGGHAGTRAKRT